VAESVLGQALVAGRNAQGAVGRVRTEYRSGRAGRAGPESGLLTQGVPPGVPQDPFKAPLHRGPLGPSPDRERAIENAPALVPVGGSFARL
jgi:hypothetical protein